VSDLEPTRSVTVTDPTDPDIPLVDLVDLDDITPDETLQAEVRRTRITTPATRALLALVVVVGAVLGGALLDRWLRPSSANGTSGFAALAAQLRRGASGGSGGAGGSGATGGGFGAGGATIGTVKLVDGTNVYVQDLQGNTIKVTTKPDTTVSVTKTGKASQLAPGSTVIVQGKQSADGTSVAATSITQNAGFGAGGAGGFPGGAAPSGARGG
jgi:hypothetical protein